MKIRASVLEQHQPVDQYLKFVCRCGYASPYVHSPRRIRREWLRHLRDQEWLAQVQEKTVV